MDALANTPARPRLHPALIWVLVGSLLASAWALWWPSESAALQSKAPDNTAHLIAPSISGAPGLSAPGAASAAAGSDRPTLSPPSRDPFNNAPATPSEAQVKVAAEPVREERAPAPPAPTAPAMNHVVIGRFSSPEGQRLIFLQDGTRTAVAEAGVALSSGYVIEAVTTREIRLRHPLADQAVSIPLPDDNAP